VLRRLTDYRTIIGEGMVAEIYRKARGLYRKRILHINSTSYGGGVAETLQGVIPLLNTMGLYVGWRTLVGNPDFFRVTKKFHNALQGDSIYLSSRKMWIYEETNHVFSKFTHIDHDLVVVHDPQPLPLIKFYRKRQPWIWRCHIDLSTPNKKLWNYLKDFVLQYDMVVYQMEEFAVHRAPIDHKVIRPGIDPFSMKNMPLPKNTVHKYVKKAGLDPKRPIITQVSRFDKWKDQLGTLKIFDMVRKEMDCQLAIIGDFASDDPESQEIYYRVKSEAAKRKDVHLWTEPHDILVNAVQRASDVVIQKSIREGFGLTATEALWKEVPVVASNVGGLPTQVLDGETGYLVKPHDYEGAAKRVMDLLSSRTLREKMGKRGKEHVKRNFLITRLIDDWLDLWNEMLS